jgi:oxalate decarboxylase/phosphoglucose isomerase-like protein (cupin superfamily)
MEFMFLSDSTDQRGQSVSITSNELGVLSEIRDVHIAAIKPGSIRGNHYHLSRRELITVVYDGECSVHWDTGDGTQRRFRRFFGAGAISFAPPTGWSHAVRNDGASIIWIFVASDKPYDRSATDEVARDSIRRVVAA